MKKQLLDERVKLMYRLVDDGERVLAIRLFVGTLHILRLELKLARARAKLRVASDRDQELFTDIQVADFAKELSKV